jgi:hypothetical protein
MMKENQALGNGLSEQEIEFITKNLKEGKPLPDSYRYVIPFETRQYSIQDLCLPDTISKLILYSLFNFLILRYSFWCGLQRLFRL